jgi:hypothetical protein
MHGVNPHASLGVAMISASIWFLTAVQLISAENAFSPADRAVIYRSESVVLFAIDPQDRVQAAPAGEGPPKVLPVKEVVPATGKPKTAPEKPTAPDKPKAVPDKPAATEKPKPAPDKPAATDKLKVAPEPAGEDRYFGYKVLGKTAIKDDVQIVEIASQIEQAMAGDIDPAKCFIPRHGLRFTSKGKVVDLVICFECQQFQLFQGGSEAKFLIGPKAEAILDKLLAAAKIQKAK